MATQFLKVDLSPTARDFEQAALEPGIPFLDKTGAHYRTLRKWLGRLIAEPEWRGTEVSFYLCDDQGNRPHDVRCEAATASDRTGVKTLKEDMEAIKRKLQEAKPDAKEAKLHHALLQHFNAAASPAGPKQSEYHFFRYQTGGQWRLVWCWGYQRKDVVPAAATICTNPTCRQLFLRRQEGSRDCPACASSAVAPPKPKSRAGMLVGAIVLILLAAGLGYVAKGWMTKPGPPGPQNGAEGLVATPAEWSGPAGSEFDFKIVRHKSDGAEEDVTAQVVPVSENPRIARVERGGARVRAKSFGKTTVVFHLGEEQTEVRLDIKPPQHPASIKFEPAEVELGVGTTARLRVQGEVGGQWYDLTDIAEWEPVTGGKVSCQTGRLQGLSEGEAVVKALYRATPKDPYRVAEAKIKVVQEKYGKLELGVSPASLMEGTDAELAAILYTADGKTKRSALGSSLLTLQVDTPTVARIDDEFLHGLSAGKGKLSGKFGELTTSAEFIVEADLSNRFVVKPDKLEMVVGELAELQVASSSPEAIRIVSSAKDVVAVTSENKLVGRKPGKAELRVMQEAFEKVVEVEVTAGEFKSIAFLPPRKSVPVDGTIPVQLVGTLKDETQVDLAPEYVSWEEVPQATIAELDVETLRLLGRTPTEDSPQEIAARVGNLRTRGRVDVVPGPLQIELTPVGSTNVPEGQTTQVHAFARYGGGNRAEIEPGRLEWRLTPASDSGLQFDPQTAKVLARKPAASLKVKAIYQGFTSNEIELRSVTQNLELALHADRAIILAGDSGVLEASAAGAPLEFLLVGTEFTSSDDETLIVDKESGNYRALKPGQVKVTAKHPNAAKEAALDLEVVAAGAAQLAIMPAKFQLLVNGRQPLEAGLLAGEREDPISLTDGEYSPLLVISQPDLVKWQAPVLSGLKPGGPFEITLQYAGKTARASVEVIKGDGKIRVVPPQARLSPGQAVSPRLEQNVSGDLWQEIEPSVVKWEVPKGLSWTPAHGELRPQVTPNSSANGTLTLEATYADKQATLQVEVASEAPPKGPLAVLREPEGDDLAVGSEQRYTIVVGPEGQQVPAANVEWVPAFENDYVRWNPPVLYAKRAGHEQVLQAAVGDQDLSFATRTVEAAGVGSELALPGEKPSEVRIVAGQPEPILLPVGTRFSSFKVEAVFGEGQPLDVTAEALLQALPADSSPITISGGQVVCQGLGEAELAASFRGVQAKTPLKFKIVEDVKVAALSAEPSSIRLTVGQRVTLKVLGRAGKPEELRDLGDISALSKLTFKSDHPEVASADGPTVMGESAGVAKITVSADGVSAPVNVEVQPSGATSEPLTVSPKVLRLRVGESKWLGKDVVVLRGQADVTDQVDSATPSSDVVIYHPESQSLEGVIPGRALVALDVGGQPVSLPVEVEQGVVVEKGRIVIEPATGKLAVGEVLQLKVWLVGEDGELVDRTASAVLASSDAAVTVIDGTKILGMSPGAASITASLSGIAESGKAKFNVVGEKFTSLDVTPTSLRISVGERKLLKIEGAGPAGRRTLGPHPDLNIKVTGGDAEAIEIAGQQIRGVRTGKVTIQATWPGAKSKPINVVVTDDPITGLRIEPASVRIPVGGGQALQVYAKRGDREQLVTSNDGVEMKIGDRRVATLEGDQTVRGLSSGTTKATASLGKHRATADIRVLRDKEGGLSGGESLSGRGRGRGSGPGGSGPGGGGGKPGGGGGNSGVGMLPGPGTGRSPSGSGSSPGSPGAGKPPTNDPARELAPGLRFIPDVLQMQLGVPGAPVRLVYVSPRGTVEDVLTPAKLEIQPEAGKDVIKIESTALGPIFVGKKVGEAEVVGSYGGQVTRDPLRVIVVDPDSPPPGSGPARLIVAPDPLRLTIGKKGRFKRVQLVPPGGKPIDVDFKLESKDESVVTIDGKSMLGMKPGTALVTVRPLDIPASLGDVKTDVTVNVESPPSLSPEGTRLVLTGPEVLTVGVPAQFQVDLDSGGTGHEVTNDGAILVLDADQASAATTQPGCTLVPKQPGKLAIRARYKDLVSGVKTVTVEAAATNFKELVLEADPAPLAIGERRGYKVWGVPVGGGSPQDVTQRSDVTVKVLPLSGQDADCFAHEPPAFVGKKPGGFAARASLGDVNSNVLKLMISDAPLTKVVLSAEPTAITIAVGERTPALRVLAQGVGDRDARAVDAAWSSASPDIAAPVAGTAGVFEGKRAGRTSLEGTYNGQTVSVEVTVTGNAFESVTIKRGSFEPHADNRFTVVAAVQANSDVPLEYRIVTVGGSESDEWKAVPAGPQKFELTTPPIRRGADGTRYHLLIEARDSNKRVVNRYPFSFKLITDVNAEP